MASSDKEAAKTTKAHMLNWARFLVNVATGATLTFTQLKDVTEVSALFPTMGERTVKELFAGEKATSKDSPVGDRRALPHDPGLIGEAMVERRTRSWSSTPTA